MHARLEIKEGFNHKVEGCSSIQEVQELKEENWAINSTEAHVGLRGITQAVDVINIPDLISKQGNRDRWIEKQWMRVRGCMVSHAPLHT